MREAAQRFQEDEDADAAKVSDNEKVITYIFMELGGHCSFQDFAEEKNVGDQ